MVYEQNSNIIIMLTRVMEDFAEKVRSLQIVLSSTDFQPLTSSKISSAVCKADTLKLISNTFWQIDPDLRLPVESDIPMQICMNIHEELRSCVFAVRPVLSREGRFAIEVSFLSVSK